MNIFHAISTGYIFSSNIYILFSDKTRSSSSTSLQPANCFGDNMLAGNLQWTSMPPRGVEVLLQKPEISTSLIGLPNYSWGRLYLPPIPPCFYLLKSPVRQSPKFFSPALCISCSSIGEIILTSHIDCYCPDAIFKPVPIIKQQQYFVRCHMIKLVQTEIQKKST